MESSFRRLWRRKKSKDTGDTSLASDGRRSSTATRPLDRLNGNDYLSVTSAEYSRTKSGNRIQPILIGISRPGDLVQRPETAVSFNTAVQRAADTAHGAQDKLRNQSTSAQGHQHSNSRSGRSIDIFRVAGKLAGYKSRFNEEIAERNLDVVNSPHEPGTEGATLPQPQLPYVPSSRYQEEVADRNASGLYGSKTSLEYERATSLTSRVTRSAQSPTTSTKHQPLRNQSQTTSRPSYEQPAYHSRQYSLKSRDGSNQPLPIILQEQPSEEVFLEEEYMEPDQHLANFEPASPPKPTYRHDTLATKPLPDLPPAASKPLVRDDIALSTRQVASSHSQADSLAAPQPPTRHPGRTIERSLPNDVQTSHRRSAKSPSLLSTTSARGVVTSNDRKIMDFTSEDGYSEASSMYGYSQYSPVLEQANTGRFERTYRTSQRPTSSKFTTTDIDSIPEVTKASTQHLANDEVHKHEIAEDAPSAPTHDGANVAAKSFSTINTVASLAPKTNSLILEKPPVKVAGNETVPPNVMNAMSEDGASVLQEEQTQAKARRAPPREGSMSRVQRAAAALEARSASQSPKPVLNANNEGVKRRSFISTKEEPQQTLEETAVSTETISKPDLDILSKIASVDEPIAKKTTMQDIPAPEAAVTKSKAKSTPQASQRPSAPTIYDSPDSLRSVDYTNPTNSFGVRTRDFAVTPVKPVKPLRKKSDPQLLQRTATENAFKVGNEARTGGAKSEQKMPIKPVAKKTTKASTKRSASAAYVPSPSQFDEEAFARKQAEAKAALLRLQQSLQEDFITMPTPIPPKKKAQPSVDDGSPVAPSSIVYPQSILTQSLERPTFVRTQTQESIKSPDSLKSPSSFRSALSTQERAPSATSSHSRQVGTSTRKNAPPSLKNVEAAAVPINHATLPPSLQQLLYHSSQQPKSPGEISLSSFPIPSSRPGSQHENTANMSRPIGYSHLRRNSNRSQTSVASQFSIPFHMIPDRSSSYRDALMEEED